MVDVESILRQAIIAGIGEFKSDRELFDFTFSDYALAHLSLDDLWEMFNSSNIENNVRFEFGEDTPNQEMIVLQLNEHRTAQDFLNHSMYDTLSNDKTRQVVGRIAELITDIVIMTQNTDLTRFIYYLVNAILIRKNVYFESKGIESINLKMGTDIQRYLPAMPHNTYMRILQVEAIIEEKTFLETTKPYDDVEIHHYKNNGKVYPL